MIEGVNSKGHNTLRKLQGNSKALFGRQCQGAEAPGASGEDLGISQEKNYCLFCSEDKGHTTRMCHVTIQKQKEIAEAAAQQSQPKQVMHTASYHSPYIPEYVGNNPAASVASASQPKHLGNSLHRHHQRNEVSSQKGVNTLTFSGTSERSPKLAQSIALC